MLFELVLYLTCKGQQELLEVMRHNIISVT